MRNVAPSEQPAAKAAVTVTMIQRIRVWSWFMCGSLFESVDNGSDRREADGRRDELHGHPHRALFIGDIGDALVNGCRAVLDLRQLELRRLEVASSANG